MLSLSDPSPQVFLKGRLLGCIRRNVGGRYAADTTDHFIQEAIRIMDKGHSNDNRIGRTIVVTLFFCVFFSLTAQAATLSPKLAAALSGLADNASVGVVIVTFQTTGGLNESHLNVLRGVGVTQGRTLQNLGMVAFPATAGQVRQLAANSAVRSIWSNDRLDYYDVQTRTVTGVEKMRADRQLMTNNGGFSVSDRKR